MVRERLVAFVLGNELNTTFRVVEESSGDALVIEDNHISGVFNDLRN